MPELDWPHRRAHITCCRRAKVAKNDAVLFAGSDEKASLYSLFLFDCNGTFLKQVIYDKKGMLFLEIAWWSH